MRKPRCAEPVPVTTREGHLTAWAACRKLTPCPDHPGGKIDTIRDATAAQAKWKRDYRRAQQRS